MRAISVQTSDVAIRVSTRHFKFDIDRRTGVLFGFRMFDSPHAQWDDVVADRLIYRNVAGLRVKDERTGRLYADPFGTGRVLHHEPRKLVHHGQGDQPRCEKFRIRRLRECLQITFEKTYPGAAFAIATEINVYAQYVRWDNILRLKEGLAERSVQLEYALPLLRSVNGGYFPSWSLWAPVPDAPFAFGEIGGDGQSQASWYAHRFPYCSINAGAGIGLPLMDVFSNIHDVGLALAAPPDLLKPELVFAADKEISQLKLSYGNIGLRRGATWRTSLLLMPHRGDWRAAGLYRDGMEFNNPLLARAAAPQRGSLPQNSSSPTERSATMSLLFGSRKITGCFESTGWMSIWSSSSRAGPLRPCLPAR